MPWSHSHSKCEFTKQILSAEAFSDKWYSGKFLIKLKYFKHPATKPEHFSRSQWEKFKGKKRKQPQIYPLLPVHLYKTRKLKQHTPSRHSWSLVKAIHPSWMRLSITTWNDLHAAQLCFLGNVKLSSTDNMTVPPRRYTLSHAPTDSPAGVFSCSGTLLYVLLWKSCYTWPAPIQIFIISFPACLLNDWQKCFTCCWDSIMARQNSKLYHAL